VAEESTTLPSLAAGSQTSKLVGSIASRVGAKSGLYLKRYFGVKKAILTVGFFERSYHPNIAGSFPPSINYEDKNTKISATYLIVFGGSLQGLTCGKRQHPASRFANEIKDGQQGEAEGIVRNL